MRRRPSPDLTPATPEEIDRALGVTPEEIAAALALPEDDTPPQRFRYTGGARYLSAEYDGQTCFDAGPGRYRRTRRVWFPFSGKLVIVKLRLLEPIAEQIAG